MSVTFLGANVALRSRSRRYDPIRGRVDVRIYEGSERALYGIVATLSSDQGWSVDDDQAPKYRLTIETPDDDEKTGQTSSEVTTSWKLLGNDIQLTLYEHPKARALDENVIQLIKTYVEQLKSSSDPAAEFTSQRAVVTAAAAAFGVSETNAGLLFDLMVKESDSYIRSQYVLRKTQTVSSRSQIAVSFTNVEKVHTTAQVTSAETIPETLLFSISGIPAPDAEDNYLFGWLKKTPTVSQTGLHFQITQEYWLEQWSTFTYDAAT